MTTLQPPPLVQRVAEACGRAGGRAVLVGGSVRDHLMGREVKDWDIEVYGLPADALEDALRTVGRVDTVGRAFSVFKIHKHGLELDVSLPRRDSKEGRGHRGILAEGDPTMTPEEAARRRDLTINAIMLDLHTGEILDPWGGRDDLGERILRPVDPDTFLEDPLRALRAVQFAARLGFDPTDTLEDLCREAALDELPEERLLGEWVKLLLKAPTPSVGLDLARRTDVLARVFPEHPHPRDRDAALDRAVPHRDALDPEGRRLALMVVVWLAPLDRTHAEATLDRLKLHRWMGFRTRDAALDAHDVLDAPHHTDTDLRTLATRAEVDLVLRARAALDATDPEPLRQRAAALGVLHEALPPLLQGRDLRGIMRPGPAMGDVLKHVYAQQLKGRVTTPDEALHAARAWLADHDR